MPRESPGRRRQRHCGSDAIRTATAPRRPLRRSRRPRPLLGSKPGRVKGDAGACPTRCPARSRGRMRAVGRARPARRISPRDPAARVRRATWAGQTSRSRCREGKPWPCWGRTAPASRPLRDLATLLRPTAGELAGLGLRLARRGLAGAGADRVPRTRPALYREPPPSTRRWRSTPACTGSRTGAGAELLEAGRAEPRRPAGEDPLRGMVSGRRLPRVLHRPLAHPARRAGLPPRPRRRESVEPLIGPAAETRAWSSPTTSRAVSTSADRVLALRARRDRPALRGPSLGPVVGRRPLDHSEERPMSAIAWRS